ncbi:MAG: glycosyltransferase family 4 protein [Polyangiaceae bacterium]
MKIAYVVHDYQSAGVGQTRYVGELARRFAGDHEVHVFANRIEPDHPRIHFHHVPSWRRNALTGLLCFATTSTVQLRMLRDFDIVHTQGFCGFYGNVVTAHICNRAWHLSLENAGGATWREQIFDGFGTTFEYLTYRPKRRRIVIPVSQRVADDLRRHYACPLHMQVIHHAVDSEKFSPRLRDEWRGPIRCELGLSNDDFVFLYVGYLRKGVNTVLEALSRVPGARLVCISKTPADPYALRAKEIGVADRVTFLGFTKNVERYYVAGDALVLPTPYDAFAMVVSEAMASGLPVIVSREAGASELIVDRENGFLVTSADDVAGFADRMQLLNGDRTAAARLGAHARETMSAHTWARVAERTLAVYEDVLRRSAG